jgi:hypothetical protein
LHITEYQCPDHLIYSTLVDVDPGDYYQTEPVDCGLSAWIFSMYQAVDFLDFDKMAQAEKNPGSDISAFLQTLSVDLR